MVQERNQDSNMFCYRYFMWQKGMEGYQYCLVINVKLYYFLESTNIKDAKKYGGLMLEGFKMFNLSNIFVIR